jgi:anti-sigma regulatory factor (Ser/Thr protein kinase)
VATVERRLSPDVPSIGESRGLVEEALRSGGFTGDVELALLLTSEVVTNVVRHARTQFTICATADPTRVRVEVTDGDRAHLPVVRHSDDQSAPDGRGLHVVDQMALDWGVQVLDVGKTVWFTSG